MLRDCKVYACVRVSDTITTTTTTKTKRQIAADAPENTHATPPGAYALNAITALLARAAAADDR